MQIIQYALPSNQFKGKKNASLFSKELYLIVLRTNAEQNRW